MRSAVTAMRVAASSSAASTSSRSDAASARVSTARAPWPAAVGHSARPEVLEPELLRAQDVEPRQSGGGQHDGIQLAVPHAPEAGVDVAAEVPHLDARVVPAHLGDAAGRSGADRRTGRQAMQRRAVAGDDDVAGILPHRNRGDRETRRVGRRQVLERVHEQVALAGEQRLAQAGREDAGAAELRERGAGDIALGDDRHELDLPAGGRRERVGDVGRLGERQRAPPCAEPQGCRHGPRPCGPRSTSGRRTAGAGSLSTPAHWRTSAISRSSRRRPVKKGTSSRTCRRASVARRSRIRSTSSVTSSASSGSSHS